MHYCGILRDILLCCKLGRRFLPNLFGNEKDDSFKGSIGAIYQSFGGEDLYPTLDQKAANL